MAVFFHYLILIFSLNICDAARILAVFSVPSISHQVVFRHLTQELARRGHDITIITPDPAFPKGKTPENITEIDVHDISYKIWRDDFVSKPQTNDAHFVYQMKAVYKTFVDIFYEQLQNSEVKELLNKKQKFDLVIFESLIRPTLVFSYIYNAPAISINSLDGIPGMFEAIGAPTHPLLYSSCLTQKMHNLSMLDKFKEAYYHYIALDAYQSNAGIENEMLRKVFGPNVPPVDELENNVAMLFVNVNPVYQGIRPVPPSVIYIGGMHHLPEKSLPEDLQSYLDASKDGVIYFSLSTNIDTSTIPHDKVQAIIETFAELPQNVLMRWHKDEVAGRTSNVRLTKWVPQSDLLRHPNVKLIITQGGQQSTDEAITAGVPLIGIPMIADQWLNTENYVHHNIGIQLDMGTLSKDILLDAVTTVLSNHDSYRENIKKLRDLMRDQPMKPLERAVWWTEHVLRHGGAAHLRSPAANISWTQYLEIELLLSVLAILFVLISTVSFIIYRIVRYLQATITVKIKKL